jgi:quercetin dioxygenase-like cupin family protein
MIRGKEEVAMKFVIRRIALVLAVAAVLGSVGVSRLRGQQAPEVKRNVLLKQDSTISGREVVMASVELPPGGREGRHTHPAEVYGFVLEGTVTVDREGQPTQTFKAGEVFAIKPGQIHEGRNDGATPVKLAAVFFAEKGKPLTTQVK